MDKTFFISQLKAIREHLMTLKAAGPGYGYVTGCLLDYPITNNIK